MAEISEKYRTFKLSRTAVHLLSSVFFAFASASSIWQYGDPLLAHLIIFSSLVVGSSVFIGKKAFSLTARKIIQIIILALALVWLIYRASNHVTIEKYLIEFLCIIGLSFGITLNMKDCWIQCFIGVILLICGSVFPRNVFIYILPVALMTGLVLSYASRLISLAGDNSIKFSLLPLARNWNYFLIHAFLVILFWIYFCTFFPAPAKTGAGFITTSSMNENVNYLPPEYSKWFNSEIRTMSSSGESMEGTTKKATAAGNSRNQTADNAQSEESVEGDGNGGGPPGNDLVFRVKSPVKLYWLGSLYDVYDGHKWNASPEMKSQKIRPSFLEYAGSSVLQSFNVTKMYSPVLYGAYMPRFFEFPFKSEYSTETTFYNCKLLNPETVKTPFSYSVISINFNSETADEGYKPEHLWYEKLKKQHYLAVPKDIISKRLQNLVTGIIAKGETKYDKAILLRDYLRNSFKYKMDALKVPEDREIADYFIFEMKEGNCQHFATSLAVLARLAGIPSRLALGFSPGNYNTLNGTFEVYEYHAHAWTQLFIEDKGWLTFDGTPPGKIISRTTPLLIGSFKDPFGDEWKLKPPELTEHTKSVLSNKADKSNFQSTRNYNDIPKPNILQRIAANIPVTEDELKSTMRKFSGENPFERESAGKGWFQKLKNIINDLKHNASVMTNLFMKGLKNLFNWIFSFQGLAAMLAALSLYAFYFSMVKIRYLLRRRRRIRKCLGIIERFHTFSDKHPSENINICYRITRELLDVSGLKREHNMELFNYGASLEKLDYNLSKDVCVIFLIYSKISYGTSEPDRDDVDSSFQRLIRIRNNLKNNLGMI
ncbi:MAG: hypothetical protein A2X48_04910 [Lentisphaerae bacterium GWF2_49_21]|nr:MAG: hypothetical protein A2X48_04910 [Lentisphaerae bacterium GWF2_49_21]